VSPCLSFPVTSVFAPVVLCPRARRFLLEAGASLTLKGLNSPNSLSQFLFSCPSFARPRYFFRSRFESFALCVVMLICPSSLYLLSSVDTFFALHQHARGFVSFPGTTFASFFFLSDPRVFFFPLVIACPPGWVIFPQTCRSSVVPPPLTGVNFFSIFSSVVWAVVLQQLSPSYGPSCVTLY